jgi:outer membrane lipoprotein carrier protein
LDWVLAEPRKKNGDYQQIKLGFRGEYPEVIELVDGFEQTTRVVFSKFRVNTGIAAERFEFRPPPGADVLRAGE